jgi:long-chain acyl-CoA synthetase
MLIQSTKPGQSIKKPGLKASVERTKIGTQEYPANPSLDGWSKSNDIHSLPKLFRMAVQKNPDGDYIGGKTEAGYEFRTYAETEKEVEQFASGLLNLGIEPTDRVGIFAGPESGPIARIGQAATSYVGGIRVGFMAEYPEERVEFILDNSDTKVLMVDNEERLQKVLNREGSLPSLETILVDGDVDLSKFKSEKNLMSVDQMMKDGADSLETNRAPLEERIEGIQYNDIAALVYTSGTSGAPKGVLLSHGNILSSVQGTLQTVNSNPEETLESARYDDVYPSVLPQGHVMGQVGDLAITASGGKIVYPPSLMAFAKDLRKIKPTVLAVTPLFLDKIHQGIEKTAMRKKDPVVSPFLAGLAAGAAGAALGGTVGAMVGGGIGGAAMQWGLGIAGAVVSGVVADRAATKFATKMTGAEAYQSAVKASHEYYKAHGEHTVGQRIKHELAKKLVFKKARAGVDKRLGGNTRAILSGGAPLMGEVESVMRAMDFGIAQGYGLAESSGGSMTNDPTRPALGTGGAAQIGTDIRIDADTEEIQIKGPTIMSGGYLNRPEKTEGTFTDDGYFKTGDRGKVIETTGPVSGMKLAAFTGAGAGLGAYVGQMFGQPAIGAAAGGIVSGVTTLLTGAARSEGKDHFAITGRLKSGFKRPNGEFTQPEPIEAAVVGNPLIARAMVVGAQGEYETGALIQPNFENLAVWAKENGLPTEPKEMVKHPDVVKFLNETVSNDTAGFNKDQVDRLVILDHEMEGKEITSKGEIMRSFVTNKYREQLEGMFK